MATYFALNTRGLDYLVSQPVSGDGYEFLLNLLINNGDNAVCVDDVCASTGMDKNQVISMVQAMVEQGRLKPAKGPTEKIEQPPSSDFFQQLKGLSSSGEVLLADMRGLVIAHSGFDHDRAVHLAATASRLLAMNEIARQRNMDLDNGRPWRLAMRWGTLQVIMQLIILGEYRFVLIVGGEARFENSTYAHLIRTLLGRYTSGI